MKKYLLLITILLLSGCSYHYNIEYKDGVFVDTIKLELLESGDAIPTYDNILKNGYCNDNKCQNKYNIKVPRIKKENKSIFTVTSKLPKNLEKARVLNSCFENVKFIEKENFIIFKTFGDFYCDVDSYKITFKTKAKVMNHNADKVKNGLYTWNKVPKEGINVQIIKEAKINKIISDERIKNKIILLTLSAILIISVIIIFILVKKGFIKYNKV